MCIPFLLPLLDWVHTLFHPRRCVAIDIDNDGQADVIVYKD